MHGGDIVLVGRQNKEAHLSLFSLSLSLSLSLQMAACFAGLSTCLNLGLVTQRRRFHDKKREEEEEEEREARMEAKAVEATSQ